MMVVVFVIHLALDFTRAPWADARIGAYTTVRIFTYAMHQFTNSTVMRSLNNILSAL